MKGCLSSVFKGFTPSYGYSKVKIYSVHDVSVRRMKGCLYNPLKGLYGLTKLQLYATFP